MSLYWTAAFVGMMVWGTFLLLQAGISDNFVGAYGVTLWAIYFALSANKGA